MGSVVWDLGRYLGAVLGSDVEIQKTRQVGNYCARHLCTGQGACPDAGLRRDDPYSFLSELSGPSIGVDVFSDSTRSCLTSLCSDQTVEVYVSGLSLIINCLAASKMEILSAKEKHN